jgi:hypothetical protein
MHFSAASASWLNMVKRFFLDITSERLRDRVFCSVPELIAAIEESIALHNKNAKPCQADDLRGHRPRTADRAQ